MRKEDVYAGKMLRTLRENANMSLVDVAQKTGVTYQQVQKYEKAYNRMSVSRICDFCKILNVNPSVFFEENAK